MRSKQKRVETRSYLSNASTSLNTFASHPFLAAHGFHEGQPDLPQTLFSAFMEHGHCHEEIGGDKLFDYPKGFTLASHALNSLWEYLEEF